MRIKQCRICGNKELTNIGSLGSISISDFTKTPTKGFKSPLELVYCPDCTLLQLAHNPPLDRMYKNYWYVSNLNPVITKDLKEIATLCRGYVISIGENDGTLLRNVESEVKIAVDPSNIEPYPIGITWFNDYWENYQGSFQVDTIVAIACIYDLPDPNKFMDNIRNYLKSDGVFIAQLMTLKPMIDNNDVGNICHEHIEYYSYKSLVRLYEQNGLEIFKVQENSMNGGSYRIFARHYDKGSIAYEEKEYSVKDLKDFFKRVEDNKRKFTKWSKGKSIVGYGASTKANTVMQYYGIYPDKMVDINPTKLGLHPIGSKGTIVDTIPEGTEYLWVFPYGFLPYFKQREKGYKGKWVTTIPRFEVL